MRAPASPCVVPPPSPGDTLPVGYEAGVAASIPNLQYGPAPEQQLDLYLPRAIPAPVLVYFHAGGWVAGEQGSSCRRSCERCAVDTRSPRSSIASHRTSCSRCRSRTRYRSPLDQGPCPGVRAAHRHGVRHRCVRSGGHLAAMVAMTPGLFEPTDLSPELAAQDSRWPARFRSSVRST